jgi:two-component system response regulator WspF
MRIAIVNDVKLAVEALRRVVISVPGHEIAWIAYDGAEAVARCARDKPDLILMDLIMPVMNGVEATRKIMKETPCAVLIVTATVEGNAPKVFDAMGYGALDAVKTPVLGMDGQTAGGQELLDKIAIIKRLLYRPGEFGEDVAAPPVAPGLLPNLVAIGSSTGGPKALADILSHLPAAFDAAIVVVQHVNTQFARDLAEWLGGQTPLTVRLAEGGDSLERGTVFLAASDNHLRLTPRHTLTYTAEPRDCPYRPSVDAFFESAKTCWPRKAVAVLLTGMGRDGAAGLLELRRAGWHTIAQDEKTSVIYGMPKAAAALGAAVEILPLDKIAARLVECVGRLTSVS